MLYSAPSIPAAGLGHQPVIYRIEHLLVKNDGAISPAAKTDRFFIDYPDDIRQ
jgi:hypothetical protein